MAEPLLSSNSDNLFRDTNVEESQVEDNTVPNPVSEMESTDNDSSFLSD
ncbi:hypothetical protein A2U01_0089617, partial [Trifolium medium]|nr:hypothetical protein [Trifolium medium]